MNMVFYQQKAKRKWTWELPDGTTKNIVDYTMVNRRWKNSVSISRSFPRADNGSDHQLVMAGIKIKLRKLQANAGQVGRRYETRLLKDETVKQEYCAALQQKAMALHYNGTAVLEYNNYWNMEYGPTCGPE